MKDGEVCKFKIEVFIFVFLFILEIILVGVFCNFFKFGVGVEKD